jgi:hypothetical protein
MDLVGSPPISTLGYATALSSPNSGFPWRSIGSKKAATTTRATLGHEIKHGD